MNKIGLCEVTSIVLRVEQVTQFSFDEDKSFFSFSVKAFNLELNTVSVTQVGLY